MVVATGAPAAGADSTDAAAAQDQADQGILSGLGLKLRSAPVFTSGILSYDLRATRGEGEGKSVAHLVTARLTADSYIYQPWFATVSGAFGFTTSRTIDTMSGESLPLAVAAHDRLVSGDRFITGSGRVSLFPKSRFPFQLEVERSDSRVDGAQASSLDFQTQSIGLTQRYQPAKGDYNLGGSFSRRDQWAQNVRDTQYTVTGDFSTRWKHHDATLGASWSQADRRVTGDRSEFRTLIGRHNYSPSPELSLNTTANWSQALDRLVPSQTDLAALQWSTVGVWQREKTPWTLTGSVRGLIMRDRAGNHDIGNLGMTLGAAYELNKNARGTANGSVSYHTADGATSRGFNGTLGANWQADTVEFKGLRYDWFASGMAGASVSDASGMLLANAGSRQSQELVSLQLGHTLARTFPLTTRSGLALNAGQIVSVNANRSSGDAAVPDESQVVRTLQHNMAATWNVSADSQSAYARASYNDSAELGGGRTRFQLLNFQLSGNYGIDRNRSLNGDLTWQRAQQRSAEALTSPGDGRGREISRNAGGEISYRHQRLFGMPRLRFTTRLKLAQDVLRQPGALPTIPDRETRLWENRLDWSIGRLESQLVFRISEVEGRRREFLTWRIQRNFGD